MSGTIVAGSASMSDGATHAFAYDLGAATPVMRDLGTLGGAASSATAVSGKVIVGSADTSAGETHAFAYDLGAATPVMRDLGTLGGTGTSNAHGVSGKLVVGSADISAGTTHAFKYDLNAATPRMRDIGTLGGTESSATAVSGESSGTHQTRRATPTRLRTTSARPHRRCKTSARWTAR